MRNEKKIFDQISNFGLTKYSSYIFLFAVSVLIARILQPELFGVYGALLLILTYSQNSHLGLISAFNKKLPYYYAKNQLSRARKTADIVFTGVMLIIFLISAIILVASFFLETTYSSQTLNGLRIMAFLVIFHQLYQFLTMYLRAEKDFRIINILNVVFGVIKLLIVPVLAYLFLLEGVFFGMLCVYIILVSYILLKKKYKLKWNLNIKESAKLIKFGFPLYIVAFMFTFMLTVDKLVVIKFLTVTDVGYYSLGQMATEVIMLIPYSVSYVMFPYLIENFALSGKEKMKSFLSTPLIAFSYLMPILLGLCYIFVEPAISIILPQYTAAIGAIKILVLTTFFAGLSYIAYTFMVSINDEKLVLIMQGATIILTISVDYWLIKSGFGIIGVAAGTLFVSFLVSIVALNIAYRNVSKHHIKRIFAHLWPFFYLFIVLILLELIKVSNTPSAIMLFLGIKLLSIAILSIPLIYLTQLKTGIPMQVVHRLRNLF